MGHRRFSIDVTRVRQESSNTGHGCSRLRVRTTYAQFTRIESGNSVLFFFFHSVGYTAQPGRRRTSPLFFSLSVSVLLIT